MVDLAPRVAKLEKKGLSLESALRSIMLDANLFHGPRAGAAEFLKLAGDNSTTEALLGLFMKQTEKDELYVTALTLETLNAHRAVPTLIRALLEDSNPHRRHAAARALGWIWPANRATARALALCLTDPEQPQSAREEAAESLAYPGNRETIEPLVSVLRDPEVRIRFWAVFELGSSCRGDARAVAALESVLDDGETPPGNWWPVGKEALAMLARTLPAGNRYEIQLEVETQRILADAMATDEDRRWALGYGDPTEN
jgi:HEAT repeat protein